MKPPSVEALAKIHQVASAQSRQADFEYAAILKEALAAETKLAALKNKPRLPSDASEAANNLRWQSWVLRQQREAQRQLALIRADQAMIAQQAARSRAKATMIETLIAQTKKAAHRKRSKDALDQLVLKAALDTQRSGRRHTS